MLPIPGLIPIAARSLIDIVDQVLGNMTLTPSGRIIVVPAVISDESAKGMPVFGAKEDAVADEMPTIVVADARTAAKVRTASVLRDFTMPLLLSVTAVTVVGIAFSAFAVKHLLMRICR